MAIPTDAGNVSQDSPPDPRLLIKAAFEAARGRGKLDWRRMTLGVLKNRLLQLTNRRFSETELGFTTLEDMLGNFGDLVRLDHTTRPTTVEFLGEATSQPMNPPARK